MSLNSPIGPNGQPFNVSAVTLIDASGNIAGGGVTLCSGVTLAAGSAGSITAPTPGSFVVVTGLAARQNGIVAIGGTLNGTPSLRLEAEGPDGTFYLMDTYTAAGFQANTLSLADNATLRLRNASASSCTNLTVTLG